MASPGTPEPLKTSTTGTKHITIIAARWHGTVVDALVQGALTVLSNHPHCTVSVLRCPGTFELPTLAEAVARKKVTNAIIALGCVVKGETPHFDFVAAPVAQSLNSISVHHCLPVIMGVLTTLTMEQALDRAGGKHGNKGADAAHAALEMITVLDTITMGDQQ